MNVKEYAYLIKMELAHFGGACTRPHVCGNACKECEYKVRCTLIVSAYQSIIEGAYLW